MLGAFEKGLPLIHFLEFLCMHRFEKKSTKLFAIFKKLSIVNSIWITKWILTMFTYTFNLKICARIWDFILLEGVICGILKLIVPIIMNYEKHLLENQGSDLMIMEFMQEMTNQQDYDN